LGTSLLTTSLPPGVKMASEYADADGINMVIFGFGGAGKTTFICHAQDHPKGRNVILLDVEKGIRSVSDRDDVAVWRPDKDSPRWSDFEEIVRWLVSANHEYKTIGVDSLTSLYQLAKESVTPGQPSQPEYGKINAKILKAVRDLKELSTSKGIHVLFTAHAEEVRDKDEVFIRMALTPQVIKDLNQVLDGVGYLEVDPSGKTNRRKLTLQTNRKVIAKYRQPETGPQLAAEIPDATLGLLLDQLGTKS